MPEGLVASDPDHLTGPSDIGRERVETPSGRNDGEAGRPCGPWLAVRAALEVSFRFVDVRSGGIVARQGIGDAGDGEGGAAESRFEAAGGVGKGGVGLRLLRGP